MGRKKGRHIARYALWRGDQCLGIGTAQELADKLKVKVDTIRWYASPASKRRDNGRHLVAERI